MPLGGTDNPWPSIDPGRFRHKITFLEQATTSDASGMGISWSPSSQSPLRAQIEYIRGTDVIKAGQDVSQAFLTITTWWRSWLNTNMRVQGPTGSIYVIRSIENVSELNRFAVLTCVGLGANT
jgi:SPP1 family predicted phage head-tail adaptor